MEDGSAPVRRTARARKVNPRFIDADTDESYKNMVGRITCSNYSEEMREKAIAEKKAKALEIREELRKLKEKISRQNKEKNLLRLSNVDSQSIQSKFGNSEGNNSSKKKIVFKNKDGMNVLLNLKRVDTKNIKDKSKNFASMESGEPGKISSNRSSRESDSDSDDEPLKNIISRLRAATDRDSCYNDRNAPLCDDEEEVFNIYESIRNEISMFNSSLCDDSDSQQSDIKSIDFQLSNSVSLSDEGNKDSKSGSKVDEIREYERFGLPGACSSPLKRELENSNVSLPKKLKTTLNDPSIHRINSLPSSFSNSNIKNIPSIKNPFVAYTGVSENRTPASIVYAGDARTAPIILGSKTDLESLPGKKLKILSLKAIGPVSTIPVNDKVSDTVQNKSSSNLVNDKSKSLKISPLNTSNEDDVPLLKLLNINKDDVDIQPKKVKKLNKSSKETVTPLHRLIQEVKEKEKRREGDAKKKIKKSKELKINSPKVKGKEEKSKKTKEKSKKPPLDKNKKIKINFGFIGGLVSKKKAPNDSDSLSSECTNPSKVKLMDSTKGKKFRKFSSTVKPKNPSSESSKKMKKISEVSEYSELNTTKKLKTSKKLKATKNSNTKETMPNENSLVIVEYGGQNIVLSTNDSASFPSPQKIKTKPSIESSPNLKENGRDLNLKSINLVKEETPICRDGSKNVGSKKSSGKITSDEVEPENVKPHMKKNLLNPILPKSEMVVKVEDRNNLDDIFNNKVDNVASYMSDEDDVLLNYHSIKDEKSFKRERSSPKKHKKHKKHKKKKIKREHSFEYDSDDEDVKGDLFTLKMIDVPIDAGSDSKIPNLGEVNIKSESRSNSEDCTNNNKDDEIINSQNFVTISNNSLKKENEESSFDNVHAKDIILPSSYQSEKDEELANKSLRNMYSYKDSYVENIRIHKDTCEKEVLSKLHKSSKSKVDVQGSVSEKGSININYQSSSHKSHRDEDGMKSEYSNKWPLESSTRHEREKHSKSPKHKRRRHTSKDRSHRIKEEKSSDRDDRKHVSRSHISEHQTRDRKHHRSHHSEKGERDIKREKRGSSNDRSSYTPEKPKENRFNDKSNQSKTDHHIEHVEIEIKQEMQRSNKDRSSHTPERPKEKRSSDKSNQSKTNHIEMVEGEIKQERQRSDKDGSSHTPERPKEKRSSDKSNQSKTDHIERVENEIKREKQRSNKDGSSHTPERPKEKRSSDKSNQFKTDHHIEKIENEIKQERQRSRKDGSSHTPERPKEKRSSDKSSQFKTDPHIEKVENEIKQERQRSNKDGSSHTPERPMEKRSSDKSNQSKTDHHIENEIKEEGQSLSKDRSSHAPEKTKERSNNKLNIPKKEMHSNVEEYLNDEKKTNISFEQALDIPITPKNKKRDSDKRGNEKPSPKKQNLLATDHISLENNKLEEIPQKEKCDELKHHVTEEIDGVVSKVKEEVTIVDTSVCSDNSNSSTHLVSGNISIVSKRCSVLDENGIDLEVKKEGFRVKEEVSIIYNDEESFKCGMDIKQESSPKKVKEKFTAGLTVTNTDSVSSPVKTTDFISTHLKGKSSVVSAAQLSSHLAFIAGKKPLTASKADKKIEHSLDIVTPRESIKTENISGHTIRIDDDLSISSTTDTKLECLYSGEGDTGKNVICQNDDMLSDLEALAMETYLPPQNNPPVLGNDSDQSENSVKVNVSSKLSVIKDFENSKKSFNKESIVDDCIKDDGKSDEIRSASMFKSEDVVRYSSPSHQMENFSHSFDISICSSSESKEEKNYDKFNTSEKMDNIYKAVEDFSDIEKKIQDKIDSGTMLKNAVQSVEISSDSRDVDEDEESISMPNVDYRQLADTNLLNELINCSSNNAPLKERILNEDVNVSGLEIDDEDKENNSALAQEKTVSIVAIKESEERFKIVKSKIELTEKEKEERDVRNKFIVQQRMKTFIHLEENLYITKQKKSKRAREVQRMACDCSLNNEEDGEMGCGDDCLNRMLMIECGSRCSLKDRCRNKQFQQRKYGDVEVFNADEKGCGIRACSDIKDGSFIMEYIGEVFDVREFKRRRKEYAKFSNAHFYFMSLHADALIDATKKGNISRFINHSCDPNAETQKWMVNGEVRIGFFATRPIPAGEEINFDYRLERYGREPQKCYCGVPLCRGWLGEPPDQKTKEEKEEDKKKEKDKKRKEEKKLFTDSFDLEDEIEKMSKQGLRNRQDTLNMSRLMVRAEDSKTRLALINILKNGEDSCKRLFLDYHGLKLLWSWMADLGNSVKNSTIKLEVLKTLQELPITNKTQLMDSRVLSVVDRWSKQNPEECAKEYIETGGSISPEDVSSSLVTPTRASKNDASEDSDTETSESASEAPENSSPEDSNSMDSESPTSESIEKKHEQELNDFKEVIEISKALIPIWNLLNEAFKIPKKKRLELMKKHEKEVDKGYREYLDKRIRGDSDRRTAFFDRFRYSLGKKSRSWAKEWWEKGYEEDQSRKARRDSRDADKEGLTKEERRERFALQVAREVEEAKQKEEAASKQHKMQEDMWALHLERCNLLGHDPYMTPIFDLYGQFYWDPTVNSWQHYTGPDLNLPIPSNYSVSQNPSYAFPMVDANTPYITNNVMEGGGTPMDMSGSPLVDPMSIPLPGEAMIPQSPLSITTPADVIRGALRPPSPPPLPPPFSRTVTIPGNWKLARQENGNVYYYHTKTRHVQWSLPTEDMHKTLIVRYGLESDSDKSESSSSSSESEEFSSDEELLEEEETSQVQTIRGSDGVEEKMIRSAKGKKRSPKLVQARVISPIYSEDKETLRRERREAKERAKVDARSERHAVRSTPITGLDTDQNSEGIEANSLKNDSDSTTLGEAAHVLKLIRGSSRPSGPVPERKIVDLQRESVPYSSKKSRQTLDEKRLAKLKPSKTRAFTAINDSSDDARRIKEAFRTKMATFIVTELNPFKRADCRQGRIRSTDDFKFLARKLTHHVMVKELKMLPSIESLECSESVKSKTCTFVQKYMMKFGKYFIRDPNDKRDYESL